METLGGGLKVMGAIASMQKRLEKADLVLVNELDEVVKCARDIMGHPDANRSERLAAGKLLQTIAASGDKIAAQLADYERVDNEQSTSRQTTVFRIRFDDEG